MISQSRAVFLFVSVFFHLQLRNYSWMGLRYGRAAGCKHCRTLNIPSPTARRRATDVRPNLRRCCFTHHGSFSKYAIHSESQRGTEPAEALDRPLGRTV